MKFDIYHYYHLKGGKVKFLYEAAFPKDRPETRTEAFILRADLSELFRSHSIGILSALHTRQKTLLISPEQCIFCEGSGGMKFVEEREIKTTIDPKEIYV